MWTGCLHSSQGEGRGRGWGGAVIPYCKGGSVRYEVTISKTSLKDAIISLRGRGLDSF